MTETPGSACRPAEEDPRPLGHAEEDVSRRRPLVAGQFHEERRRLAAEDRPLESRATRTAATIPSRYNAASVSPSELEQVRR